MDERKNLHPVGRPLKSGGLGSRSPWKVSQTIKRGPASKSGIDESPYVGSQSIIIRRTPGGFRSYFAPVTADQLKVIFNRLKKTVLIVTHDIGEAAFFGHTITLLNEGQIAQHGTFEELLLKPVGSFV